MNAQNKRVFQLRQENNPELKRNIRTPPMVIPIQLHKSNKHEQELQQSRQLQFQLQQHHSQQQRVVTSACLPPHQKVHAIHIFRSTPDEDNSHLAQATRLHSSIIDTSKSSNSSFLPPINPSSGSLKKKKKTNFISNAVASLTNGSKGSPGIFGRQSSSTPNSRNSSPMRRQATDTSPGNRNILEGKPCQLTEWSRNSADFKRPSLLSKSSSNPALTEKHNRSSSQPSPSPTCHKISTSSPFKKQSSKQGEDTSCKTMHPHRRMSLPLNKCSSQSRPQDLQTQQKSKQTCSDVEGQQPIVWQEAIQQRREPSTDSDLFLFAPASQNFIHSQRVLSRVKSATQGPSIGRSLNITDDKSEIFPISPVTCCKKENIYEEIDQSLKNEASITMTTSCYQSPSLSSSSSSSSFFLNGRADSHSGEQLDRMRLKQKSLDDGYSSQECQNLPLRRCLNQKNNPSVAIVAEEATKRLPNVVGVTTGSVENSTKSEKLKLERNSSLDGKNSTWLKNQSSYQDPLEAPGNESSSDECDVEMKHIHSSDYNPLPYNHRTDDRTISNHFQRPNNVRLGSRCGLLPPRKVQSRSKIGAYQTLPRVNNGMNSECYFTGRGFQQNSDIVCSHHDENELRRLRLLIWTERKNNEEREAEVERRWVARIEGVAAEARSIEQSLRSQLHQLRKQFVQLQDQLRKCQDVNKNRLHLFEASTQTPQSKESPILSSLINYKLQQGHHKEAMNARNHSFSSSCSSIDSSDVNANESGVAKTSSQHSDNFTLKHLRTELENCKAVMVEEQMRWMNEKNSVIEYQQRLQLNYIQAMKKNELLTEELHQLTAQLEKFQHNERQLGETK